MSISYSNIRWALNINHWKPSAEQWKLAVQCVQREETKRCYKFAFTEDCKSSMVGQLLMRKAVNEGLGLPYEKILFSRTSSGKPYLEKNCNFFFNISHHGEYCVLAAEQNCNIGIDVMKVEHRGKEPVSDYFSLMKKQFSSYEWDFITQPGLEKEQLRRFFRLWVSKCLKESYVKAIGTGIAFDLQSLSFACPTPILQQAIMTTDTKLYEGGRLQSEWKFEETFLDANHCVAVATKPIQQNTTEKFKKGSNHLQCFSFLTFEDLMKNCKPFEIAEENFWEAFQSKSEKKSLTINL